MAPNRHTGSTYFVSIVCPSFEFLQLNLCLPDGPGQPLGQLLAGPGEPGGAEVEAEGAGGAEGAGAGRGSTPGRGGTASSARSGRGPLVLPGAIGGHGRGEGPRVPLAPRVPRPRLLFLPSFVAGITLDREDD